MRLLIPAVLLTVIVSVVGLFASSYSSGSKSAGKLEVIPAAIVYQSDDPAPTEVTLKLRNSGDKPLEILQINSSCDCTLPAELPAKFLQPNQTVDLRVTISPPSFGNKESVLTIKTDQTVSLRTQIPVHMTGRKLEPPYLYGGPQNGFNAILRPGEVWSEEFEIWSLETDAEDPWVTGFTTEAESVTIEQPEVVFTSTMSDNIIRRRYNVKLRAEQPKEGAANLRTILKAHTLSDASKPAPLVRLSLQWKSSLTVSPGTIFISRSQLKSGAEIKRRINLIDTEKVNWKVSKIETSADWIRVSFSNDSAGSLALKHEIEITVQTAEMLKEGLTEGHLILQTTHPERPNIRIDVVCDSLLN